MAWLVGIDEAGYGPNLGPLVMTAVACRVPGGAETDLWQLLGRAVRRHGERDDGRLVVADSKLVYSTARGLACLEQTVLAALGVSPLLLDESTPLFLDLESLLTMLAPDWLGDLREEAWYTGNTELPVECDASDLYAARDLLRGECQQVGVADTFWCRSAVVCARRFNDLTDRNDSKAAVLGHGLECLTRACVEDTTAEPTAIMVDKHGGRNQYAALLREAFPDTVVLPRQEGPGCSVYDVKGLDRPVRVTFLPRADLAHFPVALASMVSKYLREGLMREFNAFWQRHVPGLRPTAGYPVDAARFFAAIRPVLVKLGLDERQVWRRK
jgi:ribonuclease HII